MRVVVLGLFDGVVHTRSVDASGARLHLQLAPMDAGLVIQKLGGQPFTHWPPVQPQFGLNDVDAPDGAALAGLGQCRVIVPAQVSLEPYQGVTHDGD